MSQKQAGFTLIEALLVIITITVISFAGWYVWSSKDKNTASEQTKSTSAQNKNTQASPVDPTKDWKAYTSSAGKFSLKYPATWATATRPELCDSSTLLLGADPSSVGKCATDDAGQIMVSSTSAANASSGLDSNYYDNIKTTSVTVDGVTGERQSGIYNNDAGGIGPVNGSTQIIYVFKTNGLAYQASYTGQPSYPDAQKDFDLLVTKTLKFN